MIWKLGYIIVSRFAKGERNLQCRLVLFLRITIPLYG